MGNKIPTPILDKDEALSRWDKDALADLQSVFESFARINQKDKMSKSAFENYAFPFMPRQLVERLYIVFQLQIVDETLKYNFKRSIKLNARFQTTSSSQSSSISSNLKQNNMFRVPSNDDAKSSHRKRNFVLCLRLRRPYLSSQSQEYCPQCNPRCTTPSSN